MEENLISTNARTWCQKVLNLTAEQSLQVTPLRVEASHRSFYRLDVQGRKPSLVLMVSPPALENNAQFLRLAGVFAQHRLPVPEVIASDINSGFFLMQDLGSIHLQELYATAAEPQALTAAIQALPQLARVEDPAIAPYTSERLHTELGLFEEWFVQQFLHQEIDAAAFRDACEQLVASAGAQPTCCVHRDYHCRNLLYQNNRLGIVDFQDALHGPILYDIASLLRDCYHTFDEAEIDHWLDFFISLTPALNTMPRGQIKQWFDYMAIQRQLKAIGIFARLHLRDRKSSHLQEIKPLLVRLIQLTGQYSDLQELRTQLKQLLQWAQAHPALT